MRFTIHKGKHRPSFFQRLLQFGFLFGDTMVRKVQFESSCAYDLNGIEDDQDINKLFGIGYFPSHHKNSARFGWFFDNDSGKIVLMAYCYVKGKRITEKIGEIELNKVVRCEIDVMSDQYFFWVHDAEMNLLAFVKINHKGVSKFGYKLGLFFGGNNKAPHLMKVKIVKEND